MKLGVLCMFVGVVLLGCLESDFDTNQLITENDLFYLDPSQRKEEFANDPYRIVGVTPLGNDWRIIVEYSGGCEEHKYFTHWQGIETNAVDPTNISFTLLHDSQGDACERVVRDTLYLDLVEVFDSDLSDDTLFISVVNGFTGIEIVVDPYLARLDQGSECSLPTSLIGTTCNNGFWQNQWLLLTDTVADYEKVWFQPVRGADTRIPANGKYHVGVQLLFGFQFSQKVCDDLPDGKIVPAAITCIVSRD